MLSIVGDWKSYLLNAQNQPIDDFTKHEWTGRQMTVIKYCAPRTLNRSFKQVYKKIRLNLPKRYNIKRTSN